MTKKITALLLAIVLLISMLYALPAAALPADAYFTIETSEVTAIRSELVVDVMLHNNPGISGAVLMLEYDRDVFTMVKAEKGALCSGNDGVLVIGDAAKNDVAFATADTVTGDGALMRLTFRVADTVTAGDYTIKVTGKDLEDGSLNGFTATAATDSVRVLDYLWGDANGDKVTDLADVQTILKWKVFLLDDTDLNMVAADADRSGTDAAPDVALPDALILLQWLAGYVEWDPNGSTTPPLAG